jgi:ligand-binding sensor protein
MRGTLPNRYAGSSNCEHGLHVEEARAGQPTCSKCNAGNIGVQVPTTVANSSVYQWDTYIYRHIYSSL